MAALPSLSTRGHVDDVGHDRAGGRSRIAPDGNGEVQVAVACAAIGTRPQVVAVTGAATVMMLKGAPPATESVRAVSVTASSEVLVTATCR